MILTTVILILMFLLIFYLYLVKNFNYWKKRGVVSIPNPYPLVGNLWDVFAYKNHSGAVFADMYFASENLPFVGFYMAHKPALILRDPDVIKHVLIKDFSYFCNRNIYPNPKFDPIGGNNLFMLRGAEWKHSRTKLSPLFTGAKIKSMFPLVCDVADKLIDHMNRVCAAEECTDARELCVKFMTEITVSCSFGLKAGCFEDENAYFRILGKRLTAPTLKVSLMQNVWFYSPYIANLFGITFFEKDVYDALEKLMWKVVEERKLSGHFQNDMVDNFIKLEREDNGSNCVHFNKTWIVAQASLFFFAGFETSSAATSFTLHELCLNRDIQDKLRWEILETFSTKEDITFETIESCSYLNMVISETMRKYPATHYLERKCQRDYNIPGTDVMIEKGTFVMLPLLGLHYDPKYFPDPQRYDPERFSEENRSKIPQCVYIPFGGGPRSCIGQRFGSFLVAYGLIRILSQFEVVPCSNTQKTLSYDNKVIALTPVGGLPIKFIKNN